jgi:hypothetical protein
MICFLCPSGHQLSVDDHYAGHTVRCGECRQTVRVPGGNALAERPEAKHSVSTWLRRNRSMPLDAYEPDEGRTWAARGLAVLLAVAVALTLIPVIRLPGHLNPETAPAWARIILSMAVLQIVYVLWMANAPDWGSVWVVMLVFAFTATAYAVVTAVASFTPLHYPLPLGMTEVRDSAHKWCAAVLAVMCLATYLCGRLSTRWNRAFRQEMERRYNRHSTRRLAKSRL